MPIEKGGGRKVPGRPVETRGPQASSRGGQVYIPPRGCPGFSKPAGRTRGPGAKAFLKALPPGFGIHGEERGAGGGREGGGLVG